MTDYTQATDFSVKDGLTTGDPEKAISGADVDGEFSLISTAIASKQNSLGVGSNGELLRSNGTSLEWAGGGWEWVDTYAASGDSEIEFHHDGIEGTPTNFITDWDYMIDVAEWYTTSDGGSLRFQVYQGTAYVTGSNTYSRSFLGASGSSPTTATGGGDQNSEGYMFASAGNTTGNRGFGIAQIMHAASASIPCTVISSGFAYNSSGYAGYGLGSRVGGATKYLKIFGSGGSTITAGTFRLYRRLAA